MSNVCIVDSWVQAVVEKITHLKKSAIGEKSENNFPFSVASISVGGGKAKVLAD